jgi:hypothetical protein
MADAVAFPVIPTLDEPDFDTGSTLDTRMTIFPDHGGLNRQDRLLVLQPRLSDIAIVIRLGCRMHPSKAGCIPGAVRSGAPAGPRSGRAGPGA